MEFNSDLGNSFSAELSNDGLAPPVKREIVFIDSTVSW